MERHSLIFLSNTLDEVEAELEALMVVNEWYSTAITDKIKSSRQILNEELNKNNENNVPGYRDQPIEGIRLGSVGPERSD